MDVRAQLHPGRDFLIALGVTAIAGAAIFTSPSPGFPVLHTILNTGIALATVAVSFLFWDLGWRTGETRVRFLAIVFAVAGFLEVLHVMAALEPASPFEQLNEVVRGLRSGTWAPPSYLLPLGTALVMWWRPSEKLSNLLFACAMVAAAAGLSTLFQWLPRYADEPVFLGIIRPSLLPIPLLWIPVGIWMWRRREGDRLAHALAYYALATALAHSLMLFSEMAISRFAMTAHFGVFAGGLMLLFHLIQMGTADTMRRMRAEEELLSINEALEVRVAARTSELEALNTELRQEISVRQMAEGSALLQLERLSLLQRITRAIAERQDLDSIFQVVVRSLEEHLPVDFTMLCNYEAQDGILTVNRVGARSEPLALEMAMTASSRIPTDRNGLGRCVAGSLVYEPDIAAVKFPFPQRLARSGLRSTVCVPLHTEQRGSVFGVLIVARRVLDGFSAGEREFLRQLCDHVSLAANQARLHDSLRQAYDDLRRTQQAVLEHERLRALGQMASGIAHDINNAISPVAVYVDALLTYESGFSPRAREQLEIIQRAVDDVAHTVARMGEFYRKRPAQLELQPVAINRVLREVLELTRARWSNIAQQRGIVIDARVDAVDGDPTVMAIEGELREALVNLIFNAIDAMPAGGRLILRSTHADGSRRRVVVEVVDSGVGMDDATRRRCFEPFFTTKGERGSGLGLAMVYGITQRHGAEIDIVSAPGKGTTVRVLFPEATPVVEMTSVVHAPVPHLTRILIVDDDPVLLTSLREALENEGHAIVTANGGKAGIEAFLDAQAEGNPFPVVFTDLGMPHVDGRAVTAAIKAAAPETVVFMLTGWGQRLVAEGDTPDGVRAVLSKPPRLVDLRRCLGEIVMPKTRVEPTEKVMS